MRYYFYDKIKAQPVLDLPTEVFVHRIEEPATEEVQVQVDEEGSGESAVVTLLQTALVGEYQQWDLYTAYADRLKGTMRNSVVEEFKDHAEEEIEHIEVLQRYLISMGVNPTLQRKELPELPPTASAKEIIELQLRFERDAVALYKKFLAILPEYDALRIDVENILSKEQEHTHDLELLLKDPVYASGEVFQAQEHGQLTRPQAGYKCGCRVLVNKAETKWCLDALKQLTPDIYARWYQGNLLTPIEKQQILMLVELKRGSQDKRTMQKFLEYCSTRG